MSNLLVAELFIEATNNIREIHNILVSSINFLHQIKTLIICIQQQKRAHFELLFNIYLYIKSPVLD